MCGQRSYMSAYYYYYRYYNVIINECFSAIKNKLGFTRGGGQAPEYSKTTENIVLHNVELYKIRFRANHNKNVYILIYVCAYVL